MFERMRKEKEEGTRGTDEGVVAEQPVVGSTAETREEGREGKQVPAARKQRGMNMIGRRLNLSSSLLNVATLVPLTWHLVRMAQQLNAGC